MQATGGAGSINLVTGTGTISGYWQGIVATTTQGSINIETNGAIEGNTSYGIYAYSSNGGNISIKTSSTSKIATLAENYDAISARSSGSIFVDHNGTVLDGGILAQGNKGVTVNVAGNITNTKTANTVYGVSVTAVENQASVTVASSSTIQARVGVGFRALSGGTLTNAGHIKGGEFGVTVRQGSVTVENTGKISGPYIADISGGANLTINNNAGGVLEGALQAATYTSSVYNNKAGGTWNFKGSSHLFGTETINNAGSFNVIADGALGGPWPDRLETFNNSGVVNITGGDLGGSIGQFTNMGTVNLTGGSLSYVNEFDNSGTLKVEGVRALQATTFTNSGVVSLHNGKTDDVLQVIGNVTFAKGSSLQLDVDDAGHADRVDVAGLVTLQGGTVALNTAPGSYKPDTQYKFLKAGGGVNGRFDSVTSNLAFLTPTLTYDADGVSLMLERAETPSGDPVPMQSAAHTPNQTSTAVALNSLGAGHPVYDALLLQTVDSAPAAFDALSGEIHATTAGSTLRSTRVVHDVLLNRLTTRPGTGNAFGQTQVVHAAYTADAPGRAASAVPVPVRFAPAPYLLWGQGLGSWGETQTDGNAATVDRSSAGFVLGAEVPVAGTWRLGVAGGYVRTSVEEEARASSGEIDGIFGSLYGSTRFGALSLRFGATLMHESISLDRSIVFPGFSDRARASYDGYTAQAFGEIGYSIDLGAIRLEPFAGLTAIRLHTDGFAEEGGPAALIGFARDHDLAASTLGLRAEARLSAALPLAVRGMVGWRHAFGDLDPMSRVAFQSAPAASFFVADAPIDRDAFVTEVGLDWQASDTLKLGVAYSGQIGAQSQDHAVKGQFELRF